MRSSAEIQARWLATQSHSASVADLQRAVRHNGSSSPCLSGCRSVCWKILLLSEDDASSSWSRALHEGRSLYSQQRSHYLKFIKHPEALAELTIDPLADDPASPWTTIRDDENIRAEILQDVQRLPDEANYHEDRIQLMILDILFVYCRVHPERGGYRQGMHELLAPIVHVIEQDAFDRAQASADEALDEDLLKTVDAAFVEHDAYVLFSRLMEHAQAFYAVKDVGSQPPNTPRASRFPEQSSAIVEQSRYIHQVCLRKVDPELADHLTTIEILPQIFLIRWIRLLFSREFPFNQFLSFWDAIFAIDPSLDLIDLICCSMLIRIRWQLLESDYSVCLQLLLKYPALSQPDGPRTFVDDAIYLRDHMNPSGGASLIMKYSGRTPRAMKSPESSEIGSPQSRVFSPFRRRGLEMGSSLRSPARFIQHQGSVETLFQGVLEKSERLGINQAVRDAMGEIRRNMHNLNEARHPAATSPQGVPPGEAAANTALAAMRGRNKRLAGLLEESVATLKAASTLGVEERAKHQQLVETAAAKIQFVQNLLQDSSMELPKTSPPVVDERTERSADSASIATQEGMENESLGVTLLEASPPGAPILSDGPPEEEEEEGEEEEEEYKKGRPSETAERCAKETLPTRPVLKEGPPKSVPVATIPARSTIAQSSFSWMLEPDESGSAPMAAVPGRPVASQHRKRGSNNASRERNAFLFGDMMSTQMEGKSSLGSGDIFGMEPISKAKAT